MPPQASEEDRAPITARVVNSPELSLEKGGDVVGLLGEAPQYHRRLHVHPTLTLTQTLTLSRPHSNHD